MGRQQNRQLLPLIGTLTLTGSALLASGFSLEIAMIWNVLMFISGVASAMAVIYGLSHG